MTVNLVLNPGTDNIITPGIDMWTESGGPCTLAVQGNGKLTVLLHLNVDVLDISQANVVANKATIRNLIMRSGSLTAQSCEYSLPNGYSEGYYGGTVNLDSEKAFSVYTGDSGMTSAFAGVAATDANGAPLTFGNFKDTSGGLYQGYMNADGTPASSVRIGGGTPSEPSQPVQPPQPSRTGFDDVSDDDWFAEHVEWAVEQGITQGVSNSIFAPYTTCSQAHILTFMCRAFAGSVEEGMENPFRSNVHTNDYYYEPMLWAYGRGILTDSDLDIDPNASCTRKDVVTYLWRFAGCPAVSNAVTFDDVPADADYAQAIAWAVKRGFTSGMGNNQFQPDTICNRAQIVTFLHRAISG